MSAKDNLKVQFKSNQDALKVLLDDVTEQESLDRAGGICNPIIWQTGHLAWCADTIVWLLGGKREFPDDWKVIFEYGAKLPEDDTAFPPFKEVRDKLYELQSKANGALDAFDESKFAEEVQIEADWKAKRIDALFSFGKHDFYHAGQITVLRNQLGRERPFG